MSKATITFRDQISGRLTDFMQDEGLACAETQGLLAYLVGALANYKEEGVEFTPTVLLCDSIQDVLRAIPGALSYEIGIVDLSKEAGARILKECGVLTGGNWFIYVERRDLNFCFGVAAYPAGPQTVTLHEAITIRGDAFALVLRRTAQSAVDILGGRGNELTMVFSTVREAPTQTTYESVKAFAKSCCCKVVELEGGVSFEKYFADLILRVVEGSHGTILACFADGKVGSVEELRESVSLAPSLDFFKAFDEHRTSPSAETLVKLQNIEALLGGLLKADGVVVFSDTGAVVGYRAFFRHVSSGAAISVIGGARRRAFEGICACLGEAIIAVLFRSQDGLTIHRCNDE